MAQKEESEGLTGSTRSPISYPSRDGRGISNSTLSPLGCQSGVVSELEKAWLWSGLPDDWRSLPSPLDNALNKLGGGAHGPGSKHLSNVAKVHGVASSSSVPSLPPLVGVQFFANDTRLVRASAPARGGGPRRKCEQISSSAIKNAKFVIANSEPELFSLIACTYPATYPIDGRIVKAHHKALISRIRRKFGPVSYFTAFEYQKAPRCAPHFHIALSLDIRQFGDVVRLQRKGRFGRRRPSFLTVLEVNEWLFESWLDIISSDEEISYKKEVLDWSGLPASDIQKMRLAFYECNSAVAWEVMKSETGAKHYMVKELSGLKGYQKLVPEWYLSPGRHFLYSRDMRPGDPLQEFIIGDGEVRDVLEALSWRWLPVNGRPLNKTIWNMAAAMVVELLRRGYAPVAPGRLDELRRFDDSRMVEFLGGSELYTEGTKAAWFDYQVAVELHNHAKTVSALGGRVLYEWILSQGGY